MGPEKEQSPQCTPVNQPWMYRQQKRNTLRIRKSFTIALVIACATQNIKGNAANHVKMKLKGSGNCTDQKNAFISHNKLLDGTNALLYNE
jgi:hypothetical protein